MFWDERLLEPSMHQRGDVLTTELRHVLVAGALVALGGCTSEGGTDAFSGQGTASGTAAETGGSAGEETDGGSGGAGAGGDSTDGSSESGDDGSTSDGDGPIIPDGAGDEVWDSLYDQMLPPIDGATRWVAVDGDDGNDCTDASPCATIFRALETIEGGGQIVVRDGHYTNVLGMRVNDNTSEGPSENYGVAVPSGLDADHRTVIRAEHRFGVRLTFQDAGFAWRNEWIRLDDAEFVWVDGFIVDWLGQGGDPTYIVNMGRNNVLSRTILRRDAVDDYGGMITMGAEDSRSLVQDVHGVGGGRYMIQTGPGTSGTGGRGTVRRAVFRFDFAGSNQPMATFSHYGNNSGDGSQGAMFQNAIAIDGPNIDTGLGAYSYKWGSYYNPKNALEVRYQGSMSIAEGGRTAFWVNDNVGDPQTEVTDALVVGADVGSGLRVSAGRSNVSNSTFLNVDECFQGDGVEDSNNECMADIPEQIIGRPDGAEVEFAYGRFLSVWGDEGHDEVTEVPLWPFPYEGYIKMVFAEPLDPPSGYTPSSNDTRRGFCADESLDGSPLTLTRYIYELGGTPIPEHVYADADTDD